MEPALQAEFRRRSISRLCHFTPIVNLPSIFDHGSILSVEQARAISVPLRRIDHSRWDGELHHVSLSVEYPNTYLMRTYGHVAPPDRPNDRRVPTAVLDVDPLAVEWTKALFSPVNAAAGGGRFLGAGLAHFRSLFDREVPNLNVPPRGAQHPASCPTDLQAEVMLAGEVPTSAVRRIFVERNKDVHDVRAMGLPVPVSRWPAIFYPESLSASIRRGNPPTLT